MLATVGRMVRRVHNGVVDAMAAIAALALLVMAALIAAHVMMRFFFDSGVRGVNELSQYLLVALVYAGLAVALRDGSFIRVQLLLDRFDRRRQAMLIRFVSVLSLAFVGLLTWQSWTFAIDSLRNGTESIGVLETSLWIPQSIVAIGSTALTFQVLAILIDPRSQLPDGVPSDGASATLTPDQRRSA